MTILHLDGFDHCDFSHSGNKYLDLTSFAQGEMAAGRFGGKSFHIGNTGFGAGIKTRIFHTSYHRMTVGIAFRPLDFSGFTNIANTYWLRFEAGGAAGTQLAVKITSSGRMEFYSGGNGNNGSGSLIGTSTFVFTHGQWRYVELDVLFGLHGSIEMRVDDSQEYFQTNLPVGSVDPDRVTLYWQAGAFEGLNLDDYYITDGGFLGPIRISSYFPVRDTSGSGFTRNTGAHDFTAVDDNFPPPPFPPPTPDDDVTYLAGTSGARDMFAIEPVACFGRNLAIAVNGCARYTAGPGQLNFWSRLLQSSSTITALAFGDAAAAGAQYKTTFCIVPLSLTTGIFWTDREIAQAEWGVGIVTGTGRVTQFFVEKATTLRSVPYDCGNLGSYSF